MSTGSVSQRWAAVGVVCLLVGALIVSFALSQRGGPKPVVVDGHTVTLTLAEYSITPQSVSLPTGSIRIIVKNRGIIAHNLTVEDERLDSQGERVPLGSTNTILAGSSRTISLNVSRPGRYLLTSTIANQADLGMTGTMIVR